MLLLRYRGGSLDLSAPVVMGVLNVTPDSFSDGGRFQQVDQALAHARRMHAEGAAIIDVGGESTRPGAAPLSVADELRRVIPVVEALAASALAPISVDTSAPEVMQAAIRAGAHMINDVRALQRPGALQAAAASGAAISLMHMQGEPTAMQAAPAYGDVVREVGDFLAARVAECLAAGIARERLCIDPGFGFGKTTAHNLALLRGLHTLLGLELPLLVGLSRKRMSAELGGDAMNRLPASLVLAAAAVARGARIVRAHDVAETVSAVRAAHVLNREH